MVSRNNSLVERCKVYESTPRSVKDFYAWGHGFNRIRPIKRTRKRQIEKAKWLGMTPLQKRRCRLQKAIVKVFTRLRAKDPKRWK